MNKFNILLHQLKHHLNANNIISYTVDGNNIIVQYNKASKDIMESIVSIDNLSKNLNELDVQELLMLINSKNYSKIDYNFNITF